MMIHKYIWFSEKFLVLYLFVLAVLGRYLREYDLDYVVAMFLVAWSGIALFTFKLSKYDLAWLLSLFVAVFYLIMYSLEVNQQINPVIQSLMFFLPLISLLSRQIEINEHQISKLVFILSATCLLGLLPYYSEVLTALTTSYERSRFHTFFSIAICFPIVSVLLAGLMRSKWEVSFLIFALIVFSGAAAHRSLYLAFVVQFIYWAVINGNGKALVRPLIGIIFGFGLLLLTDFGEVILRKFSDSASGGDGNTESRLFYYGEIFRNSLDNFLGIGFGEYFRYGRDSKGQLVPYALQHNSYLSYLYFLGWPCFIFSIYWQARLYSAIVLYNNMAIKVVSTSLVGMSFFSILNVFLEQPVFGFLYWLLYGTLIGLMYRCRIESLAIGTKL